MIKVNKNKIILIISIMFLASCSKILIEPNKANTPKECFNQFWQTLNDKYVFFDLKKVNWDNVKSIYEPQIKDNMTDKELALILSKIIYTLRDGHTNLYTPNGNFRYNFFEGYAKNFDSAFVSQKYLVPNSVKESESIKYCLLNTNIGYIHYPSFSDNTLTTNGLDKIFNTFTNTKGLIIDIRNNTGGDNDNIIKLMEHFVQKQTKVGSVVEKKDASKNSFTTPYEIYIAPKGVMYSKPIVVLTNRLVFSSANIFAGFISQLPNVKLIGDITGGGTGVPTSNELPNGWRFRYSSSIVSLANGDVFEDGLKPTIKFSTDSTTQVRTGKDAIIERAILELK